MTTNPITKRQHLDLAAASMKALRKRCGAGWDLLTPEIQEALFMQHCMGIIRTWETGEGETAERFQARIDSLIVAFEATIRPDDFSWPNGDLPVHKA